MTATEARQITAAAKKTAINGIYDKIRIAANEGQSSILFVGSFIVDSYVVEKLTSGNENEKFDVEFLYIDKDRDKCELTSIRW